jgi:hypothetical protein
MNNSELIADRIEEVIARMFAYFRSFSPGATEYSMFYNPGKHASWFIIIFFADKNQLRESLKNGICYQMYSYLNSELDNVAETSTIKRLISFEPGNQPKEQIDIDNFCERLINKQEALIKGTNKSDIGECNNCGHNFEKHQLLCNLKEDSSTPTEGWIICPEEDCNCFQTWSANYKGTTQ